MTEQEREELIEKMANGMFASKQYNGCFALMDMARAALAVAEPVIREQAENALRAENARLREAHEKIGFDFSLSRDEAAIVARVAIR
jgi:mannose/cellobiose epimerase-like protein (N-acyl-D-glucosamine 2-epimerase family)